VTINDIDKLIELDLVRCLRFGVAHVAQTAPATEGERDERLLYSFEYANQDYTRHRGLTGFRPGSRLS